MKKFPTKTITYTALLIALQVVLGSLVQVQLGNWKQFNFGFLAIAAAGILMGPVPAMIVGALGDVVGTLLFPTGAYFPGFTLSNALVGLIYGLTLRRGGRNRLKAYVPNHDQELLVRAILASVLVATCYLLLNSYWLSILYGSKTYAMWLSARAATNLVEIPLCSALLLLLQKALLRLPAALLPETSQFAVGAEEQAYR